MKKLAFEYGSGLMEALLPDNTDVFIPGETVADPSVLADIPGATLAAIRNPIGMSPISESVKKGDKVVIVFPDRVKGGTQADAHRKVSIPLVLGELYAAGVEKKDIRLVCSNGLHRKNTREEIKVLLGEGLFNDFWWSHQITNHDSEDYANLVDLGQDDMGNPVIMNKEVHDAAFVVMIGHTLGNPYGGYSGGYKHCATGITHWRSIASHHVPHVMHRGDFTPVSNNSLMRRKFDSIGEHMEKCSGKKFFTVDAVLDSQQRQIAVFAGWAKEMQPLSWAVADKRTYVHWADRKYDVMIFGMPQQFHYGNGMGTNPVFMMQAISAQIVRHKRVMKDHCVVICASICNGYFHDQEFPSYRPLYEEFQRDYNHQLTDLERHGEYYATNEEWIRKYRFDNAYHPFHVFSMVSCAHIAEMNTSAIYIVGAQEPGLARSMGMKTRATFEEALGDAAKYVGNDPSILALPRAFKLASVHLGLKGATSSGAEDMGGCCAAGD